MVRLVLLGEPGSGKTTISRKIYEKLNVSISNKKNKYLLVEASKAIIYPIANLIFNHNKQFKLPEEKILIQYLIKENNKTPPDNSHNNISRKEAAILFKKLKYKYGKNFIARFLHEIYFIHKQNNNIIISGARGLENSKYFRLNNYLVIYLKSDSKTLINRLCRYRKYSKVQAIQELEKENKLYNTKSIEKITDIVIDTSRNNLNICVSEIISKIADWNKTCIKCVNSGKNPSITFDKKGYCNICSLYIKKFDKKILSKDLDFLKTFKNTKITDSNQNKKPQYDCLVGISGGKDSTATLYTIKKMGFNPLAVTFNLGYLPSSTIKRSIATAKLIGVDHEVIDIRKYITSADKKSYTKTAKLYEKSFTLETKINFKKVYENSRKKYSIKFAEEETFVRSCQLCRRMVIRAYYGECIKRGIQAIVLGMNEWTNLDDVQKGKGKFSGVRKLQPDKKILPVYVFHLPFILQRNSIETKKILNSIRWKPPKYEDFIESNSNSCLFARSTERMAKMMLEFHPDSTRLAREVTCGFITKTQALKALRKIHPYKYSPRQVLEIAKII